MHPAIQGLLTIAFGVGGCVGYFYLSNIILDTFIFPARGKDIAKNIRRPPITSAAIPVTHFPAIAPA